MEIDERTSSRAGVAPAEVQRLSTAHCYANNSERLRPLIRLLGKVDDGIASGPTGESAGFGTTLGEVQLQIDSLL